jgi:hypothetical protein
VVGQVVVEEMRWSVTGAAGAPEGRTRGEVKALGRQMMCRKSWKSENEHSSGEGKDKEEKRRRGQAQKKKNEGK